MKNQFSKKLFAFMLITIGMFSTSIANAQPCTHHFNRHCFHGFRMINGESVPSYETFLDGIFPNPVSQSTIIGFGLADPQNVSLKVYDMTGRLVKVLADAVYENGDYEIMWNITDESPGIYFMTMEAGDILQTEKIIIAK